MHYITDVFDEFSKWALLTVGNREKFNMMTIGWGGLGTVWRKPAATVYVRTSRYTHDFMESNDYFTIGTFEYDWYHDQLKVLGTKSGRDMDKMHDSELTPIELARGMTFREVDVTLVCKKIFKQRLDPANLPEDIRNRYYDNDAPHDMYIGEVVERYFKEYHDGFCGFFKEGCGNASNSSYWKVCYDDEKDRYTAMKSFSGAGGSSISLYEITKEIFEKVGTFEDDDYKSERLIGEGRELYRAVDEKWSPPYDDVSDKNYKELCPWVKIEEVKPFKP